MSASCGRKAGVLMGSSDRKGCSDQELWKLLALAETQLEQTDLVLVNLTVARGIPALADLDIDRYCQIVDGWTEQFARWLPGAERSFQQTPWKWKSDIR